MQLTTILSVAILALTSSVSAQTACAPVASAVPTCGVRRCFPGVRRRPTIGHETLLSGDRFITSYKLFILYACYY